MGRKSRKSCTIKPFCFFCLREFHNEKVLIQHQKAKHFKCPECNRKLETANGLLVHLQQVHKSTLNRVPNSLEGRDNITSTIQGMNGVPVDIIEEHRLQHYTKLNNINKQKQQRINWTQIQLPNSFTPIAPINTLYNNAAAIPTVTNTTATATTSTVDTNKVESENVVTGNKLLILDAYGLPIQQEKPDKDTVSTKLHIKPFLTINHSTTNTLNTVNGVNTQNPVVSVNNTNGVDVMNVSNKFESGWDVKSAKSEENMKEEKVIYYKVTGSKPLPIPLPSIPNTKLSYSTDEVFLHSSYIYFVPLVIV
uniref:C2H2-type domain-containing protein n=1 Tax=Theileria annulata TaxID=5874 RepID=A0A3B0MY56_THEAN